MKNDMLDFNVIKFFCINTRTGKVLRPLPIIWEFPSLGWVKTNTDGAARRYHGLATCGGIFRESMGELLELSLCFLKFRLITVFYGVIHVMEEAQKMEFSNVWLECDSALVCVAFVARTNVAS